MNADPIDPSAMVDSLVPKGGPPVSNAKGSPICGVYGIWCEANEKWYVGQSRDIRKRWVSHRSRLNANIHPNHPLQNAWNKYGEASFLWVLLACLAPEELHPIELEFTAQLQAKVPSGFVLSPGGLKTDVADSTREKLAAASRGHKLSAASRQALSEANKGRVFSEEHRRKISQANTGKPLDPVRKAILLAAITGRHVSDETRAKISASSTGKKMSLEACAKMSKVNLGRRHTPEARAKISAAGRGRKQSEETIEKRRRSRAGFRHTEETKLKMSMAKKELFRKRRLENEKLRSDAE